MKKKSKSRARPKNAVYVEWTEAGWLIRLRLGKLNAIVAEEAAETDPLVYNSYKIALRAANRIAASLNIPVEERQ